MTIDIPSAREEVQFDEMNAQRIDFIKWYLNCKHWKCPDCNLTNFGRNKKCADPKCRKARPAIYDVEESNSAPNT